MPLKFHWSFPRIAWALFYILVLAFFLWHSFSYLDPDFGWHLKMGQEIAASGQVPRINVENYTLFGEPWVDHEWLSNLTIFQIYNEFGYIVLNFVFSLIPVLALVIINLLLKNKYKLDTRRHALPVIICEALSLVAVAPSLGVRIQEITFLFLSLLLLIIFIYNKNKNYQVLFFLWPLLYLWSNLHGGFLLGLAVLFMFIVIKTTELIIFKNRPGKFINFEKTLNYRQIFIFSLFSLGAGLLTLLTPYRLELYSFLFGYKNTFYLSHILEWLPQWSFPYQYPQFAFITVVILALVFSAREVFIKKTRRVDLWEAVMLIIFLFLAIKSRRHFALLFAVSFPWLLQSGRNFFGAVDGETQLGKISSSQSWPQRLVRISFLFIMILGIYGFIIKTNFVNQPFSFFCENKFSLLKTKTLYPCAAVEFLQSRRDLAPRRLFNDFGWGGFLIWQYPGRQLFIDGRMPQATYGNQTILEEYFDFFRAGQAEPQLQKHEIDLVLISQPSPAPELNLWERKFLLLNQAELTRPNELLKYLESSAAWRLIYSDSISLIYQRE